MKKEFGKWLMDIAKYITTAVILSSMIGDIREKGYCILLLSFSSLYRLDGDYTWLGTNKRKGNSMNAGILMMIFVIAIANIGGMYFYIRDKRNLKHK